MMNPMNQLGGMSMMGGQGPQPQNPMGTFGQPPNPQGPQSITFDPSQNNMAGASQLAFGMPGKVSEEEKLARAMRQSRKDRGSFGDSMENVRDVFSGRNFRQNLGQARQNVNDIKQGVSGFGRSMKSPSAS